MAEHPAIPAIPAVPADPADPAVPAAFTITCDHTCCSFDITNGVPDCATGVLGVFTTLEAANKRLEEVGGPDEGLHNFDGMDYRRGDHAAEVSNQICTLYSDGKRDGQRADTIIGYMVYRMICGGP